MAGPYPPNHGIGPGVGSAVPPQPRPHPQQPTGHARPPAPGYPAPPLAPVPYPPHSRRLKTIAVVAAVVVAVAVAAVIGYAAHGGGAADGHGAGAISKASAQTAIQDYLDALVDRDIDAVARNTLCGIYDGVTDRRPDNAVARMGSDAFRKQFAQAEVTSIDKIVYLSDAQAQALFTMRVTRLSSNRQTDQIQGVAQLLAVGDQILVCSYVLRSAGTF